MPVKLGLLAMLEAKPGKEAGLATFLEAIADDMVAAKAYAAGIA